MAEPLDIQTLLMTLLSGQQPQMQPPTQSALWSPAMEQGFQDWYAKHAQQWGLNPNPDDPLHHYDYRAAYLAGVGPDKKTGHWPSVFKAPDHPNRFVLEGGRLIDTINGQVVR